MNSYTSPLTEMRFVLFDVLEVEKNFSRFSGLRDMTRDLLDPVLEEASKFCEQVLAPLNQTGDTEGCELKDGIVHTPTGFKEAYKQFVEAGWTGLTAEPEFGGQGIPAAIGAAVSEMINASNLAWGNYPLLSHGACEALRLVGLDWQKEVFLKSIISGRWTGTMCLTEPHCGSDLGLLKTRAEPQLDGTFKIYGTKIFITAGEHEFTDNIVHLVLARLPDAPPGTKGISLFIVPKIITDKNGQMHARNAVSCGSIEHKMGIMASATCVMNFDGASGYLIGEANRGLNAMFIMMNTARLAVGLQGLGISQRAFQNSFAYAKDRLQMRSLSGPKQPDKPADPLIVHPDIRRMLLTQKSLIEAGRALSYFAISTLDILNHTEDAEERKHADDLIGFLTPIVKAMLTENVQENTYHALQIFGGHGYVKEWGMEQLARDARITTIYEGTTQIQALDLLGRKIIQTQGPGFKLFLLLVNQFCEANADNLTVQEFIAPLKNLLAEWQLLTLDVGKKSMQNPEELGAAAYDFLHYSGYVAFAYFWAKMVAAAHVTKSSEFAAAKLETARFYYARILPRTATHASAIRSGAASLMSLPEAGFAS